MSLSELSRRSLLKTLSALVASPAGVVLHASSRSWSYAPTFTGFRIMADGLTYAGMIQAQRSDGQFFQTSVVLTLEDQYQAIWKGEWMAMIRERTDAAWTLLHSFLDPRCECRITGHREYEDAEGGYHYESVGHTCALHA